MKFTNALSIFTAPFPLPFMGEDAGEAWTCKQYLVMISVRPKGVAVDEDITPSFRFQYAAHVYDPEVSISRPILAYTVEQICFSETTAKKYLDPKKKDFLKSEDHYFCPFFFTMYHPNGHTNFDGIAMPDAEFSDEDKANFRVMVFKDLCLRLSLDSEYHFKLKGSDADFCRLINVLAH